MTEGFDAHMSDADALMWNIEKDPLLRSTIVTVLVFDRAPDFHALRDRIAAGAMMIPRMRERVATPMFRVGPPYWSEDPHFDIDYHLRRVRAPAPATFDSVLDIARCSAMSGFDRARPLWEYTLVEGLHDGRAAFVMKVHHSMTDGVGGMRLLIMLFDLERNPIEPTFEAVVVGSRRLDQAQLIRRSLDHRRRRAMGIVRRGLADSVAVTRALRADPVGTVRDGIRTARSIARYLAPATVPESPIMRSRTLARRLGSIELPLDDLKRAAKAVGCSLNDAFVSAVTGGLRRYHAHHGALPRELRMTMPISLRDDAASLGGNHFTPARFLVPIAITDPAERTRETSRRCREMRDEPAVQLTDALAGVLNQLPTALTTSLFGSILKGADFVTSNVPGAAFPLFMAGAELERMWAFAPLSGTSVNVTLVSHNGTCCIGVNTDAVAVPDTETFLKCLQAGFDEVVALGESRRADETPAGLGQPAE